MPNNIKSILENVVKELPKSAKETEFPTGIDKLDEKFWMKRKEYTIIAARTSNSKTNLALTLAIKSAEVGRYVWYLSLEMTVDGIAVRYMSQKLKLDNQDIRRNNLDAMHYEKIATWLDNFGEIKLEVFDNVGYEFRDLSSRITARKKNKQPIPDMIILDYMNNTKDGTFSKDERIVMAEYTHNFYELIKENNICGVVVVQIGRDSQGEGNARTIHSPQLHHLKGTGCHEETADHVIICHYPHFYNETEDKYKLQLILAKNRHGPTGTVWCKIIPEWNYLTNLDEVI